ncbi:angiotensin-converting enzyme [Diachasma alloeum]|uniref:angiotensin-converting enzyme n=1 Tax=Diachasma alloeum TaxID=454923 RepID=UPI00073814B1|nr:angiotensin-converting enzyme [Diachasma alloeum]
MRIAIIILSIYIANIVQCDDTSSGPDDFRTLNSELLKLNEINAILEWESATRPSPNVSALKREFYKMRVGWREGWCDKLRGSREERIVYLLCRGPKFSPEQASLLSLISDELMMSYQSREVCDTSGKCFRGEPELRRLMATSRDEGVLRWAWTAWRDGMSPLKSLFMQFIALENSGARRNGYRDVGDIWREEMGIANVEVVMETLWSDVEELYQLLHAVVRFRLRGGYPGVVDPLSPIPAHLLGDLWGQNWGALLDVLLPEKSVTLNITESLRNKNYSVLDMVKRSEDFYVSLGFPRLPKQFWKHSIFTRGDHGENCHGFAANMNKNGDFRIMGCFEVTEEDFRTIHHEMGHVYYYMAYEGQDAIFRSGVNSAFHESIGEAVLLGVMTPQHLQRIGLAGDAILTHNLAILLKEALIKLPLIASALIVEKWRFRIFEGNVESTELNDFWWELHRDIMGIAPVNPRPDHLFFDPPAKFHIIANIPYLRYFFASFLQFQIFDSMCQSAVTGKINNVNFTFPLHKCDIYGSKDSTKNLRSVMKMGSSVDLSSALQQLSRVPKLRVEPLTRYFKPVYDFLRKEIDNFNIPVGWS